MRSLTIQFDHDGYDVGDVARVTLDGAVIRDRVLLEDGTVGGFLEGVGFLEDPHLEPAREPISITTNELRHGLHEIEVVTIDEPGNESEPVEQSFFLNTGPKPPTRLKFKSQQGGGAIVFALTPARLF